MKQFFGVSQSGNLKEAVRGLHNPQMLLLMSNPGQFEQHVEELEKLFPQAPTALTSCCKRWIYFTGILETCSNTLAAAFTPSQKATTPTPFSTTLVS